MNTTLNIQNDKRYSLNTGINYDLILLADNVTPAQMF